MPVVAGLQDPAPRRHARGLFGDRAGQAQSHLVARERLGDRLGHVVRHVARERAGRELGPGVVERLHAVHPERTPVLALEVPRHQIPAAAGMHQPQRFDQALAGALAAVAILHPQPETVAAGRRNTQQRIHIGGGSPARQGQRDRVERAGTLAQARRQPLVQLGQQPQRRILHAADAGGGSPQGDRDGHGLVVLQQHRRHGAARPQPVATAQAGRGIDGIAEFPQPFHVAAQRTAVDVQPLAQFRARPVAARLQQRQQAKQTVRGAEHRRSMAPIEGGFCPR